MKLVLAKTSRELLMEQCGATRDHLLTLGFLRCSACSPPTVRGEQSSLSNTLCVYSGPRGRQLGSHRGRSSPIHCNSSLDRSLRGNSLVQSFRLASVGALVRQDLYIYVNIDVFNTFMHCDSVQYANR